MMKKTLIFFLVLVLSVGILAVPTGAEHETDPNATTHSDQEIGYKDMTEAMRDYIDQHKADLDERERLLQELNNYAAEIRRQTNAQMNELFTKKLDEELKEKILDNSWELYQLNRLAESDYWKLYNFVNVIGNSTELYKKSNTQWRLEMKRRHQDLQDMFKYPQNRSEFFIVEMLVVDRILNLPIDTVCLENLDKDEEGIPIISDETMREVIRVIIGNMSETTSDRDNYEIERQEVAIDGGREFASDLLNKRINKLYNVMYPFGIAIMLVCWMIGMTRSGLNATFDIKDKDSIARSMIDLVIGIGLLALAPWIIETMTSLGFEICDKIGIAWRPEVYEKNDSTVGRWVIDALGIDTAKDELLLALIRGTLVMNIMRIGLMQCLAPLSIGCIAGGDRTKNMAFGWLKEYLKLCLLPAVTAVYICLACAATHTIDSMWINIIIGLSYFVVPKMMLDKLFG